MLHHKYGNDSVDVKHQLTTYRSWHNSQIKIILSGTDRWNIKGKTWRFNREKLEMQNALHLFVNLSSFRPRFEIIVIQFLMCFLPSRNMITHVLRNWKKSSKFRLKCSSSVPQSLLCAEMLHKLTEGIARTLQAFIIFLCYVQSGNKMETTCAYFMN